MIHRSIKSTARASRALILSCALLALAFYCPAATVTFTLTNSVGPDTNYIVIRGVNPHANADGSYQSIGVPFRIYPNVSGFVSTNINNGTYLASNAFIVSTFAQPGSGGTLQGVLFNVDNTTNTYPFTRYLRSGYNIYNWYLGITGIGGTNGFIIVTNGDGTVTLDGSGFSPTSNQIFTAFGFLPLTPTQTTNAVALATNNYTSIVLSNVATYINTNALPGLTNKFATTNYAIGLSNSLYALIAAGGAVQTNGFTAIVFSNQTVYINTNQIAAVTNRHLLTNDSRAFSLSNNQNTLGNITAAKVTNTMMVLGDSSGGTWQIGTNAANNQLTITNSTTGGTITIGTDGMLTVPSTITGGNVKATTAFTAIAAGPGVGYIGDGRNLTNINATNLFGFVAVSNLTEITSNQLNANTWGLATNRDGGNANFATNLTAGLTNQWRTDATNTATYYSNLLALFSISTTNGYTTIIRSNPTVFMHTNLLPALTNFLASSNAWWNLSNTLQGQITTPASAIANSFGRGTNTMIRELSSTNTGVLFMIANNYNLSGANSVDLGASTGTGNAVLAGANNSVLRFMTNTAIIGGNNNAIGYFGTGSGMGNAIVGGAYNQIADDSSFNFITGLGNNMGTAADGALFGNFIAGTGNKITAHAGGFEASSGSFALGTSNNIGVASTAYTNAFALGRFAQVLGNDTFEWNDGGPVGSAGRANTFIIGASGGVGINTNNPADNALSVHGRITSTNYNVQGDRLVVESTNYLAIYNAGTAAANEGLYQWDSAGKQYTNANTGSMVSNNSTVWIIKDVSGGAGLYTSSSLVSSNWTPVGGVLPSPVVAYGAAYKLDGDVFEGYLNSTDLVQQFTTSTNNFKYYVSNAITVLAPSVPASATNAGTISSNLFNSAQRILSVFPEDFGAYGDGDLMTNIYIATSSPTNLTIKPGSGSQKYGVQFTSSDVGKNILIYGAGRKMTNGISGTVETTNCISSVITSFVNATNVIISNSVITTVNGALNCFAVYGHDDSASLSNWLNFSTNFFSLGGRTNWKLTANNKIYVIANAIYDPQPAPSVLANNHVNSQLFFPNYTTVGDFTKEVIVEGATIPSEHETLSTTSAHVSSDGTIFWSFYVSTNAAPENLHSASNHSLQYTYTPSIFSCQNWAGTGSFIGTGSDGYTNNFNPFRAVFRNLTIRAPANPCVNALNLGGATGAEVDHVCIDTGMRVGEDYAPIFTNASAIILPLTFCDPGSDVDHVVINSFWNGITCGEHVRIQSATIQGCENGIFGLFTGHWTVAEKVDASACHNMVYNYGGAFGFFGRFTIEGENNNSPPQGLWWYPQTIVNDWNNSQRGYVIVDDTGTAGLAAASSNDVAKIGGTNVDLAVYFNDANGGAFKRTYLNKWENRGDILLQGNIVQTNSSSNAIRTTGKIILEPGGTIATSTSLGGGGNNNINYDQGNFVFYLSSQSGLVGIADPTSGIGSQKGTRFGTPFFMLTNSGGYISDLTTNANSNILPPGGSGIFWNSNADLYWVSRAPFGTTWTTNLIQGH